MIKKIGRFFKTSFLLLWLIGSTTWALLAVNFGDSNSSTFQLIISSIIALIGLISIVVLLFVPCWRNRLLSVQTVIFLTVLLWWLNIQPANDRLWQADVSKLAHASVEGNLVTVHNIRNFTYQSEFDYEPGYYDKTFDLNKLEGVDLFAVYWMGPAIAHIIMSFDFGEHNHLAVSIEARKEEGEGYSTIKGFFRQYELIYIVADERDVIGLRTHYRKDPPEQVYRYRSKAPKENARGLFLEYIDNINALYETPAFYNTLLSNCTTVIWLHSRVNPGHLPFSWKILLSGYVPEYLYESGRLDQQLSFTKLRNQAYINPLVEEHAISALFSSSIRP
ncbi:MAG: DUF4105 domain-containing protein [Methylococcales bacterium]|nr:DUF4105 domain-containing protein [Methylococcales bacterium]